MFDFYLVINYYFMVINYFHFLNHLKFCYQKEFKVYVLMGLIALVNTVQNPVISFFVKFTLFIVFNYIFIYSLNRNSIILI